MGTVDTEYFVELGKRITALRKKRGITQVELSRNLGFSQQQVLSFEKGRRRIPVSLIPQLAEIFGVSCEELLGVQPRSRRCGRSSKLEQQLERLSKLPRSKQRFVADFLDTVLQQAEG